MKLLIIKPSLKTENLQKSFSLNNQHQVSLIHRTCRVGEQCRLPIINGQHMSPQECLFPDWSRPHLMHSYNYDQFRHFYTAQPCVQLVRQTDIHSKLTQTMLCATSLAITCIYARHAVFKLNVNVVVLFLQKKVANFGIYLVVKKELWKHQNLTNTLCSCIN